MTEISIQVKDSPYIFNWIEGTKTVNISAPGDSTPFTCVR